MLMNMEVNILASVVGLPEELEAVKASPLGFGILPTDLSNKGRLAASGPANYLIFFPSGTFSSHL